MAEEPRFAHAPRRGAIFDILDTASVLLDAPLILEDADLNVIAWSAGQASADSERLRSIVDRHPEPWLVDVLRRRGILDRLAGGAGPLFAPPASAEAQPRMGCGVLIDGRLAGYLWAATANPFDPERAGRFEALAQTLAELLGHDTDAPPGALTPADLAGNSPALERVATRLGLHDRTISLLAVPGAGPRAAAAVQLILRSLHPEPLVVPGEDATWAVLPWDRPERAAARARQLAEVLARQEPGPVAIADPVVGHRRLPAAMAQIRLIQNLQLRYGRPAVAAFADVQVPYALLHLSRALDADGQRLRGVVDALRAHDAEKHTELVATLRSYLDSFGDAGAAAQSLHLHTNTFRYRMRRIVELTGFDPRDGEQRFVAELQLRLPDDGHPPAPER
ncbi:helix-turn-helix domain-containing protein [Actinoplanes sp. NPDC051411]|uniref:PucR family transcriptional regulator n=1 Tax=Actinoplanes sp. NPDC051411 TaxID=3155522 RepID=UPI00343BB150